VINSLTRTPRCLPPIKRGSGFLWLSQVGNAGQHHDVMFHHSLPIRYSQAVVKFTLTRGKPPTYR